MQYMEDAHKRRFTADELVAQQGEREAREARMRKRNNRLGLMIFQGSWILVFVCLVFIYWVIGFQPGWRPTAEERPGMLLPTIATIILFASVVLVRQGVKLVIRDEVQAFLQRWGLALLLGAAFLGIMVTQFSGVPANDEQQYGYVYRLMIGYHAVHVIAIGFLMFQVWRFGRLQFYDSSNHWNVEAAAQLWYFVTVAWVLFYIVLYLI